MQSASFEFFGEEEQTALEERERERGNMVWDFRVIYLEVQSGVSLVYSICQLINGTILIVGGAH